RSGGSRGIATSPLLRLTPRCVGDTHPEALQFTLGASGFLEVAFVNGLLKRREPVQGPVRHRRLSCSGHRQLLDNTKSYLRACGGRSGGSPLRKSKMGLKKKKAMWRNCGGYSFSSRWIPSTRPRSLKPAVRALLRKSGSAIALR